MNWDDLHSFLKQVFQPINEGMPPLSPQEFWQQHSTRIQQFDDNVLQAQFTDFGNGVWLPKAYETARILYNLRQRRVKNGQPNEGRELVEGIRIEVEARRRPERSVFTNSMEGMTQILAEIGGRPSYSQFQVDGWRTVADSAIALRKGLVVVAPTGAGKTEVFLLPLMAQIAFAMNKQPNNVPHFVLVYPRVALLKDQLKRVLWFAYRTSQKLLRGQGSLFDDTHVRLQDSIIVGLQYGGVGSKRDKTFDNSEIFDGKRFLTIEDCPDPDCNGFLERENAQKNILPLICTSCHKKFAVTVSRNDHAEVKPHILVTTLESLDNFYLNPRLESYMQNIDGLVFDEVHLYSSLYGAHVANIVKRIENFQEHGKPLIKIASSATVSNPERFVAKLFYGNENTNIEIHDAHVYPDLETAGLETLLFLRSPDGEDAPPPQATLLQAGMAVGHGVLRPNNRTILFTESVDHVNRTAIQLQDAEKEQRLWQFRSQTNRIFFSGQHCPQTNAFDCNIYSQGECWRGVHGGANCVTHTDIIIKPLDINVISSRNRNDVGAGDLVVATASLEVGVDDENFKATVHYRPPFNVFSFIQRRGRAGRAGNEIAYTVMVLGNDANDEFYFRRRNRLIDGSNYELPLNPQNPVVSTMHDILETERGRIGNLYSGSYSHDSKSLLIWLLAKYRSCATLTRLFDDELKQISQRISQASNWSQVQRQQDRFKKWIDDNYVIFKHYLDIEIMLQELEARLPQGQQNLVKDFRQRIEAYRGGSENIQNEIVSIASQLMNQLSQMMISPDITKRESEDFEWLHKLTRDIARNYSLPNRLNISKHEITALYQFFTVWHEKLSHPEYGYVPLNYVPQALKLTLQSLYYVGVTCLDNHPDCASCIDFYIPDSYFQEVKPILVQTLTPDEMERDQLGSSVEVEDSTKLASMLTLYKPFYRYSAEDEMMSVLITEHNPNWVTEEDEEIVVGVQLRADGLHLENGSFNPRRIFVRPIRADNEGKNVLRLCMRCYRLHDEDTRQLCSCDSALIPVKLFPQPLVEREATLDDEHRHQLSENFEYCGRLTGHTIIRGSEVSYRRMFWNATDNEYRPGNEDWQQFRAIYRNQNGQDQPLQYSILTSGIIWNLEHIVDSLMRDDSLRERVDTPERALSEDMVLHTAAHMLHKAVSTLSGVSEQVLEYAIFPERQQVILWERYEGGIGLSDIIRNIIREEPIRFYRELLYSAACPVHLSESVSQLIFANEPLRQTLAERWRLDIEDELIENVVREAVAERRAALNSQAEDEQGCVDGCPACIHINSCTDRGNQPNSVSRAVAEQIIERLLRRGVTQPQLEGIQNTRMVQGITPPNILYAGTDSYDVLCL